MSVSPRSLAGWSVAVTGVVVIGVGWLWWRADERARVEAQAEQAVRRYDLFHPRAGVDADVVQAKMVQELQARQDALLAREQRVVLPLPDAFLTTDLSAAEGLFREVLTGMQQKAQRQGIVLSELPFRRGVEAGVAERRQQLAQLYVLQQMMDVAMDAGVASVGTVRMGVPFRDESGHYAVIPCEYEVSGSWAAVAKLLDLYGERQTRSGCGLLTVSLERRGDQVVARCGARFITPNQSEWGLAVEEPAATNSERGGRQIRRATRKDGG